jgi:hypothetical protein
MGSTPVASLRRTFCASLYRTRYPDDPPATPGRLTSAHLRSSPARKSCASGVWRRITMSRILREQDHATAGPPTEFEMPEDKLISVEENGEVLAQATISRATPSWWRESETTSATSSCEPPALPASSKATSTRVEPVRRGAGPGAGRSGLRCTSPPHRPGRTGRRGGVQALRCPGGGLADPGAHDPQRRRRTVGHRSLSAGE